jgi:hypothetical protein
MVLVALLLVGLFAFLNRRVIGIHSILSAGKRLGRDTEPRQAETSTNPQELLAEANRLFWLNNGPKAAPLYAKAENLFANSGDARNALYAKVGRLRSNAETMSFVELSQFLNEQIQRPLVRDDPSLHLWCLIAKGYTDIEIDYRASKRDWLEVQDIAKSLGEDQWVTRASGRTGPHWFPRRKSRTGS